MEAIFKNLESIITTLTLFLIGFGVVTGWIKGKKISLKQIELPTVPISLSKETQERFDRMEERLECIEQTATQIEENTRRGNTPAPFAGEIT